MLKKPYRGLLAQGGRQDIMDRHQDDMEDSLCIREMTIDDFAEVFHLGEQLFTSDYSPSMYRTWDEYEITTLYNSDCELCLEVRLPGLDRRTPGVAEEGGRRRPVQ